MAPKLASPGWYPAPARQPWALEEICRRGQRVGRDVETAAGAVVQDVLGQELRVADLAVHRAARARREDPAIDQRQRRVELVGEIGRAPAVIGERRDSRQGVLIAALTLPKPVSIPQIASSGPGGTP